MKEAKENKKEKVVNFGLTEALMDYLNNLTERSFNENEDENKKPGLEVKRVIAEMAKKELEKIQNKLNGLGDDDFSKKEWFDLMEKANRISDLIRWY